jgi:dienelactone hydrolase
LRLIAPLFHAWERRLSSVDTNRVVRPFDWGLDWIGAPIDSPAPDRAMAAWSYQAMTESDRFYAVEPGAAFTLEGDHLTFPSALVTPHPDNNTVHVRLARPRRPKPPADQPVVVVLPQWNADAGGHVGLCQLLARFGVMACRLSLPYHDLRKPPELERADYIVSANVGRTAQVCRQAVLDVKRTIDWLWAQGYRRIGLLGTSLGSCLSMLTMAHDERIQAAAFNHVSPYFADVVWHGISTRHVRAGLEGHITLDALRDAWLPISPYPFIERVRGRRLLLVYARYDLTFPVDLSKQFLEEFNRRDIAHDLVVLPCGHYTSGKAPFKFLDGYILVKFFVKNL